MLGCLKGPLTTHARDRAVSAVRSQAATPRSQPDPSWLHAARFSACTLGVLRVRVHHRKYYTVIDTWNTGLYDSALCDIKTKLSTNTLAPVLPSLGLCLGARGYCSVPEDPRLDSSST